MAGANPWTLILSPFSSLGFLIVFGTQGGVLRRCAATAPQPGPATVFQYGVARVCRGCVRGGATQAQSCVVPAQG